MEIQDNIFVLRTNIKTNFDKVRIAELLNTIKTIEDWNVDMEDIDCVLRVVSTNANMNEIIIIVKEAGFECSELE